MSGKILNLTPQCFIDVLVLALFWELRLPQVLSPGTGTLPRQRTWITVDHVFRVLLRLGAVTQAQVNMVRHTAKGQEHQRKLRRHCGLIYADQQITNRDSLFLCRKNSVRSPNILLSQIVRGLHLELLDSGAAKAPLLEEQYKESMPKEKYLEAAQNIPPD